MNANGSVKGHQRIDSRFGGFGGDLHFRDYFGRALAGLGDLNGDGSLDLAVGSADDDGGLNRGAVWILSLQGCPLASSTTRNGAGINPSTLTGSPPGLGQPWSATLDCSAHSPSLAYYTGRELPSSGLMIPAGEILVDMASGRYFGWTQPHAGNPTTFSRAVPDDIALCGLEIFTQGVCLGAPNLQLSNALDLAFGR